MKAHQKTVLRIIPVCIAAFIFSSALPTTMAASDTLSPTVATAVASDGQVSPANTNFEWRYRFYNGKLQRRLWSHFELRWITD